MLHLLLEFKALKEMLYIKIDILLQKKGK